MGSGWGAAHRLSGRCPHDLEAVVPVRRRGGRGCVRAAWLAVPAGVGLGDGEAEFLEFGDELAQAAVVVEPGAVVGELVVGQDAGGGLAVFLAGPLVVGAVQPGRADMAAAVRPCRSGSSGPYMFAHAWEGITDRFDEPKRSAMPS